MEGTEMAGLHKGHAHFQLKSGKFDRLHFPSGGSTSQKACGHKP
jgi:hypothetical protein